MEELLRVRGLTKHFPIQRGFFKKTIGTVKALEKVDLEVYPGEMLGLVGESGCGKSTLGRCLLNIITPTGGEMTLNLDGGDRLELHDLPRSEFKRYRKNVQMIFQDPHSSLNPHMTVYNILREPLLLLENMRDETLIRERIEAILLLVGLKPEYLSRYPHSFSGGQRQRVGIARAIITHPKLIVSDEPVSALDVSIQAQILNLLKDMQETYSLAFLFITHDLAVVRYICDRVVVMYLGNIVEVGRKLDVLSQPFHPYTIALLQAIPKGDGSLTHSRKLLEGELPDPINVPSGCVFHPRCTYRQDICMSEAPVLREIEGRKVKCHFPVM